jgi:uncharacterized protein involved in exopolysaccharide biosynthesis
MNMPEAIPHYREADTFDFKSSWAGLVSAYRSHRRLVWLTTFLTVGLVLLYVATFPKVYRAEVLLAASSPKDDQRDEFYSMWAVFRRDDLADEVQLFTSKPVLSEVAQRLKLTYDDVYHPPLSHLGYLWQESWPGRGWRATKEFFFPTVAGPYSPTPEQIDLARTVDAFKAGVGVEPIPETNIGRLVVRGPSPRVAEVANEIVQIYFKQRQERQSAEAQDAYKALAAVTEQARKDLLASEQLMQRYYTNNDMLLMFEKDKVDIAQMLTARATIQDLRSNLAANINELATVNRQLAGESRDVLSARTIQANPISQNLKERLAQVELARKMALLHYRPDSPEVRELERQAEVLKQQLQAAPQATEASSSVTRNPGYESLRTRKAQLEAGIAGQRAAIVSRSRDAAALRAIVDNIPEKMKVSHDLGREHQALEKKYTVLQDKLMIAAVSAATVSSVPNPIRIVEPATPPMKPSWPMTKLLLVAATIIGFAAGLGLALLLNMLQGWVSRPRLARMPGLPGIYGEVTQDRDFAKKLYGR